MTPKVIFRRVENQPPANRYIGHRGLHYVTEGGRPTAWVGAPAIVPAFTDGVVVMTEAIQRLSYDLMRHFCPTMTGDRWRTMHGARLAMTNGTGYDDPMDPDDIRADFINGRDMDKPLPSFDKCRTFQGSFISGTLSNNLITCVPGVDGIDAHNLPSLTTVIAKGWYSVAINTGDPPFHFRPNWQGFIAYPFILDGVMKFKASFFAEWNSNELPEPLETYNPT